MNAGDFNIKTSSNILDFLKTSTNVENESWIVMETIPENSLVLTNTLFSQKMAYWTTWTSLEKVQEHIAFDGMVRLDLYRNQIDYVICKNIHKELF